MTVSEDAMIAELGIIEGCETVYVFDDKIGFVRLDGKMADDLSVVNSARVSFHKRQDEMDEPGERLIHFLMREKHGTPFEHNSFRFHIMLPIFVAREWQRHRISSYNEWSARYSQLEPKFYIPKFVRTQTGKPGAYTFEPISPELAEDFIIDLQLASERSYERYEAALGRGIAKEQARLYLPVNIYTEMYWTVNARSLMNFLSLRRAPTAMFEIREYATAVELFFKVSMPVTWEAFNRNGRKAP